MDDRYLFRAYIKKLKWIVPVSRINFDCETVEVDLTDGNGDLAEYDFDEIVLMGCTGLKDKNDKLIFEGDIVKYQLDNDDCPFPNKRTDKIIGKIFFSSWRASFSVTAGKNLSDMLNNDLFRYVKNGNRVEVIGNIHENPELLEGSGENV